MELADEKYRIFSSSLTPGKDNIIGVRLPVLRKMAKELARGDWREYIQSAGTDTFEEVMLHGMVIGCIKADIEEILRLIKDFIPLIDNWAVCDSFCSGLKFVGNNRERVWDFLQPYFKSDKEFEIRFAVVTLIDHYISQEYIQMAFEHFDRIKHEGYYVKMAVAWTIAEYYTHFPEQTLEYLKNNSLDNFTYNKSIQKITESFRIDTDTKAMLKTMKRR